MSKLLQGTGTSEEMALEERTTISTEGCVIADVAILRPPMPPNQAQASTSGQQMEANQLAQLPRLRAHVRVKSLAMWTDQGRLGQELCRVSPPCLDACHLDDDLKCSCKAVCSYRIYSSTCNCSP